MQLFLLDMHGLYWTLLLGQVSHDRCCQCLLVLSRGPMLQWWLGTLTGEELLGVCTHTLCGWLHTTSIECSDIVALH